MKAHLSTTERHVWKVWSLLSDDEPSPVKRIARALEMEPADVAFIVYPAETFGRWADDQEPDLP
jgi:Mn-dependent DtxR family transcriptional regulator